MKFNFARTATSLACMSAIALAACGGGGGGGGGFVPVPSVENPPPPPPPAPAVQPVSGYRADRILSSSSTSAILENDVYFIGADGTFRTPTPADFTLDPKEWTGNKGQSTQSFTVQSVTCSPNGQTFAAGSYSAMMLFDRSGSMNTNDPDGLSLEAGRIFADTMKGADQAAVAAFPQSPSNNRTSEYNIYGPGFMSDKDTVKRAVGSVGAPDGDTPLYDSMLSSLSYTARNGSNPNKAVLAFTDGEDTASSNSANDAINESQRIGIPLFTIGLTGGDTPSLSRIARETNGAFFYAADARQLSATYKALAAILSGSAHTCTVTIKTDLTGPGAVFSRATGTSWTYTRSVDIDGTNTPFIFRADLDVVQSP